MPIINLGRVKGADGKSAYQSYLDTTTDDPVLSEAVWAAGTGNVVTLGGTQTLTGQKTFTGGLVIGANGPAFFAGESSTMFGANSSVIFYDNNINFDQTRFNYFGPAAINQLTALGATTLGRSLFAAATPSAARTNLELPSTYAPIRRLLTGVGPHTAAIGDRITLDNTSTVAQINDPTGTAAGQTYTVIIQRGTTNFNGAGTVFAASRFEIVRAYNGTSWSTLPAVVSEPLIIGNGTAITTVGITGAALVAAATQAAAQATLGVFPANTFDFLRASAPAGATGGNGTWVWTLPAGAKAVTVIAIGGGCGGGSGARRAVGTNSSGGGGGASNWNMGEVPVVGGASVTVTVGAGGAGGAAVTADNTNGNNGSQGGLSGIVFNNTNGGALQTWVMTNFSAAVGGGTGATSAGGLAPTITSMIVNSNAGAQGAATANGSTVGQANGPSSGGGGGGVNGSTEAVTTKGFGVTGFFQKSALVSGYSNPGAGGNGGDGSATGIAQSGSNGTFPGGAGGGGGGSRNGFNSGAGGNGAEGLVRLIVKF